MKARIPHKLSTSQVKSMESEIRKQCVKQTQQYECLIDTVSLWVLHTHFGFGAKRLKRFYDAVFTERQAMQERYEGTDSDDMAEFAMYSKLKDRGINVKEMFEAQEKHRFVAKVR
jgi:hypothetical protein